MSDIDKDKKQTQDNTKMSAEKMNMTRSLLDHMHRIPRLFDFLTLKLSDKIDQMDKKFNTKFESVDVKMKDMELKTEKCKDSVVKDMGRMTKELELNRGCGGA